MQGKFPKTSGHTNVYSYIYTAFRKYNDERFTGRLFRQQTVENFVSEKTYRLWSWIGL